MTATQSTALKRYRQGTHRTISPVETIKQFGRHAAALGITRVADVTGLDYLGIPVFVAMRPNGRSLSVSQGKGLSADSAYASAFMEAAELEHAAHIDRPKRAASFVSLSSRRKVVRLDLLPRIRGWPVQRDTELLWIEAQDLRTEESIWLPYELVHADFTLPPHSSSGHFLASTNGLASGNHLLEATCAGLCETIERDATRLWRLRDNHDRASRRLILSSVSDPDCRTLLERLKERGMTVAVWDATTDIAVPCFLCRIREAPRNRRSSFGAFWGAGCHLNRGIALVRALTEAAQSRLTHITGSRDDLQRRDYTEPAAQKMLERLTDAWERGRSGRRFGETSNFDGATFEDDLKRLLKSLHQAGLGQALRVELTNPHFNIPVVRIVVPGLEADSHHGHYPLLGPRARALAKSSR